MFQVFLAPIFYCVVLISNLLSNSTLADSVYESVYGQSPSTSISVKDDQGSKPQPEENKPLDYLQELKNLGFYKAETADENLNIRNSVVRFQANHNLIVDGIFGPISLGNLEKRLEDTDFRFPDVVASAPTSGKWIAINKTKRILTLYEGKTVSKKYPVAIGSPSTLTPDGKHTIVLKIVNPDWGGGGYAKPVEGGSPYNPLGYRWIGLSLGGGGEYGIHGNNSPYSIGTDASHGCVRMINSDVEELFDIVSDGVPVWINSDQGLREWGVEQNDYFTPS